MVVLPMPPYAIVSCLILYLLIPPFLANASIQYDIANACKMCELHLDECQPFLERLIKHGTTDEILKITLAEANRYAILHDKSTIGNALKVRAFVLRGQRIQDSALGSEIPTVDDPHCKWHGQRPWPPYINYQIDNMANQIIDKHRKIVLKSLKSLVFGKNAISNWYEAYLNIYLLLSTLEHAYQWQQQYVKMEAGTVSSTPLKSLDFPQAAVSETRISCRLCIPLVLSSIL